MKNNQTVYGVKIIGETGLALSLSGSIKVLGKFEERKSHLLLVTRHRFHRTALN